MTEDEAKTKWCHRRIPDKVGLKNPKSLVCIASECMAWRWQTKMTDGCRADPVRMKEAQGYCGLAGAL